VYLSRSRLNSLFTVEHAEHARRLEEQVGRLQACVLCDVLHCPWHAWKGALQKKLFSARKCKASSLMSLQPYSMQAMAAQVSTVPAGRGSMPFHGCEVLG